MKKFLSVFLPAVFTVSAVCAGAYASPADKITFGVIQCTFGSADLKAGQKIARFFRNIFRTIADFFRKIFGVK